MQRLRLGAALAVAVAAGACSHSQTPVAGPDAAATPAVTLSRTSHLDAELVALLTANSNGVGLDYFRLPGPNELDRIPQDPKNPLTRAKVELGRMLYHETALGVDNVRPEGLETYSCASCHHEQGGFQANLPQGMGEGGSGFGADGSARAFMPIYDSHPSLPDCQPIRTPSAMNTAYQELMLWNGQFGGIGDNLGTEDKWTDGTPLASNKLGMHGLETQAHAGLAVHRMVDIELSRVADIPRYRAMFRVAFPGDADPVNRLNEALAIAAYERSLLADHAPFQRWLRGDAKAMTPQQTRGAVVFFGDGGCVACHTGPALSSMTFHALGMNDLDGACDARVNLEPFGGTVPADTRKGRGGFTGREADMYAFKTPQLYNLADSPFYGHGASFPSVRAVIEYKNAAIAENTLVPAGALSLYLVPLGLTSNQIDELTAFIEEALYDPDLARYLPHRLPSGNCFPENDPQSRIDLGCERGPVVRR